MKRFSGFPAASIVAALLTFLPVLCAEARDIRTKINGMGVASDSDRAAAADAAKENAEAQLFCVGEIEGIRTVTTGCVAKGEGEDRAYICSAVASATCVNRI